MPVSAAVISGNAAECDLYSQQGVLCGSDWRCFQVPRIGRAIGTGPGVMFMAQLAETSQGPSGQAGSNAAAGSPDPVSAGGGPVGMVEHPGGCPQCGNVESWGRSSWCPECG
ncbi:MAG TPA: hypothetical protein VGH74_04035, partial [Planctomycetaceae bacterium]